MKLGLLFSALAFAAIALSTGDARASLGDCSPGDFVNLEGDVSIAIQGTKYVPACIRIKTGSTVTIDAVKKHPLNALPDVAGAKNPFRSGVDFIEPTARQFVAPGTYGFYCTHHGDPVTGQGMGGEIQVVDSF